MCFHECRGSRQAPRSEQIVSGEQHDVLPLRSLKAVVVGGNVTHVALMPDDAEPALLSSQLVGDIATTVGTGVIDHDCINLNAGLT
jgi:hypothetical protein